jgi:hypothetical protein
MEDKKKKKVVIRKEVTCQPVSKGMTAPLPIELPIKVEGCVEETNC